MTPPLEPGDGPAPSPVSPVELRSPGLTSRGEVRRTRTAITELLKEALGGASGPYAFRLGALVTELTLAIEARVMETVLARLAADRDTVVLSLPGNRAAQKAAFLYAQELEDDARGRTPEQLQSRKDAETIRTAAYRHIEERLAVVCTVDEGAVLAYDGSPWLTEEASEIVLKADWSYGPGLPPAPGFWVWAGKLESRATYCHDYAVYEYDTDWHGDWRPMAPDDLYAFDLSAFDVQQVIYDLTGDALVADGPSIYFSRAADCPPDRAVLLEQAEALYRQSGGPFG